MNKTDEILVQQLCAQYTEKSPTRLDALKALDRKVKAPATGFAWSFGTLAALILGSGMSLVMTDIGEVLHIAHPFLPGVSVGVVGLVMVLLTYPTYRRLLAARRRKYAGQILALTEELAEN